MVINCRISSETTEQTTKRNDTNRISLVQRIDETNGFFIFIKSVIPLIRCNRRWYWNFHFPALHILRLLTALEDTKTQLH